MRNIVKGYFREINVCAAAQWSYPWFGQKKAREGITFPGEPLGQQFQQFGSGGAGRAEAVFAAACLDFLGLGQHLGSLVSAERFFGCFGSKRNDRIDGVDIFLQGRMEQSGQIGLGSSAFCIQPPFLGQFF